MAFRCGAAAITEASIRATEGTIATASPTCSSSGRSRIDDLQLEAAALEALAEEDAALREVEGGEEDDAAVAGQAPIFFSGSTAVKVAVSYASRSFMTSAKGSMRIAS